MRASPLERHAPVATAVPWTFPQITAPLLEVPVKHLERPNPSPRGLRRLLRPGPRPWFHRSQPGAREAHDDPRTGSDAVERDVHGAEFESLVDLYRNALRLRDRAHAETRVGEDALSVGDELKASQHFSFGDHYRRRAEALEEAARRRAIPVCLVEIASDRARQVYGADLALVRPDQHLAWRGAVADERALAIACGWVSNGGTEGAPTP